MLLIVLHMIPDTDDPHGIVAELMEALPVGSHLVLAHPASDIHAAARAVSMSLLFPQCRGRGPTEARGRWASTLPPIGRDPA